jgi:hypothetical protein
MRKVGIKQFQKNNYKELANPPFIITRNGKDYRMVMDIETTAYKTPANDPIGLNPLPEDGINIISLPKSFKDSDLHKLPPLREDVTTQDAKPQGKCQLANPPCRNLGYKYRISFYQSEGEITKEIFLCGNHVKKAKQEGTEVEEV